MHKEFNIKALYLRYMKVGDKVLISPDLTRLQEWVKGTVIEVESNPFVGIVISAETEDKNVFFGQKDLFKPRTDSVCLTVSNLTGNT